VTRANLVAGIGWMSLAIACWTPLFSVAKRTLPVLDAFALGTVRYALGVTLFVLLLAAVEGRRAIGFGGRMVPATLVGLVGITGFNLFVWIGLVYTRPEHASIILALQSPLTALAVWLIRGQRPARFTLGCTAAAIGGVLLVVTKGDPLQALADIGHADLLLGDLLVFCGAISWVTYTLAASRFTGWTPLRFTVMTCIPGAVGLVIANGIALAAGVASIPSLHTLAAVGWQILYFSVCTVVLGVLGFNAGARALGPLNAILMLNLIPVGVFAIEAALGRSFAPIELAGAAIVIGALVANNLYLRGISTSR
jgi:drug/metabolite transporter (DMT)-like permease